MKNAGILGFVVFDVALLAVALLLFLTGYPIWGAVALVDAGALVVAAAWWWSNSPEPADPVDEHAAQVIRALSGQPAVLPEQHLLLPGRHADLFDPYQEKRYHDGFGDI